MVKIQREYSPFNPKNKPAKPTIGKYADIVLNKVDEMYGPEAKAAATELLLLGFEGSGMSEYFDTWHYLREEAKGMSQDEWEEEARDQAHDVAMSLIATMEDEFNTSFNLVTGVCDSCEEKYPISDLTKIKDPEGDMKLCRECKKSYYEMKK